MSRVLMDDKNIDAKFRGSGGFVFDRSFNAELASQPSSRVWFSRIYIIFVTIRCHFKDLVDQTLSVINFLRGI